MHQNRWVWHKFPIWRIISKADLAGRIISNEIVSMPKKDDLFLVDRAIRDGKQSLVVSMESQS